jgi:hypothetical protein
MLVYQRVQSSKAFLHGEPKTSLKKGANRNQQPMVPTPVVDTQTFKNTITSFFIQCCSQELETVKYPDKTWQHSIV